MERYLFNFSLSLSTNSLGALSKKPLFESLPLARLISFSVFSSSLFNLSFSTAKSTSSPSGTNNSPYSVTCFTVFSVHSSLDEINSIFSTPASFSI